MSASYLLHANDKPVHLTMKQDLSRAVRKGHPWVFADSLKELPVAQSGSLAVLKNKGSDIVAKGMYDPKSPIAFRVCAIREKLDNTLIQDRMTAAIDHRLCIFNRDITNGFRLFNGEGDGLPGLVCDVYNDYAVFKLDGAGPTGFYNVPAIAALVQKRLGVRNSYLRLKTQTDENRGQLISGNFPSNPVEFKENGVLFRADLVQGQKTGFFLDQRDNRARISSYCRNARVLNVFGYTGGFSVYAGRGGASSVTTVDIAPKAIEYANANWELNGLPLSKHNGVAADAFKFLEEAALAKEAWNVVIVDPPSFAPAQKHVEAALARYETLITLGSAVTAPGGILAAASCSSHVDFPAFLKVCEQAIAKSRKRAFVLGVYGQPEDHPFPMACEELRYLKFILYKLEA